MRKLRVRLKVARAKYEEKHGKLPMNKIADLMGVHRTTVSSWFNNDITEFNLTVLEDLCNLLDCDITEILQTEFEPGEWIPPKIRKVDSKGL